MADVDVKVDQRKFKELRAMLANFPRQIPKISNRAINKVATWARTRIVKKVAKDIGMRQRDVRKKTNLRRSSWSRLIATIWMSPKRFPVYAFKGRQTKFGVTYRMGRGRKRIRHAFVATMRSGHKGVFKRKYKRKRLPILEMHGPSIAEVYENVEQLGEYLLRRAAERLDREISTQAELFLAKKARKTG